MIDQNTATELTGIVNATSPKAGVKTSEFYLAVLVIVANIVGAVAAIHADNPQVAGVLTAIASVTAIVYAKLRQMLKAEAAGQTDLIPDQMEAVLHKYNEAIAGQLAQTLAPFVPAPPVEPDGSAGLKIAQPSEGEPQE